MVFVLILAAISLAMTLAMLLMVSRGSFLSGQQKRFRTAVEASRGGMEAMFQPISNRGNPDNTLYSMPNAAAVQTKLAGPIGTWGALDNASTIDPAVSTSTTCRSTWGRTACTRRSWTRSMGTPARTRV